jgi:C4-dicarboxylate-specific signal transduction histidine kinase
MEINFDSLSPFWLMIDDNKIISSCCDHFLTLTNSNIDDTVIFNQPSVDLKKKLSDQILDKLIIFSLANSKVRFRANAVEYGDRIVLIAWPLVDRLEKVKTMGLTSLLIHPACQLLDTLIVKDVLKKSQQKLYEIELKTVEEQLKDQKEINKHQAKLASIGEMAAGVGHEINNPLAISMGNTSLLEQELKKDDSCKESIAKKIEKIKHGHDRIRRIVDGMRIYARSDSDLNEIISIRKAIDLTVSLISDIYEKDGVVITRQNPTTKFYTKGSLGKLQQIILNLISNAKDSTEGQSKREIYLSLKKNDSHTFTFAVRDNGCGIPDDIKDKILNPFFTTKEVGKGAGLGLGFVNEMTKELKGFLSIETAVDKGSTFSITLPLESGNDFE